ncbi:hypothetical protein B296_00050845 [Ensete ventricosum]|uniref:Uncharacterized protein n=1 Tax=Ensete ventricosum TaxID=4639 RepID=A0A426Y8U9_ENSVE|nr:hypothetical protein B296_00050845 [Ensete ventricosum]
MDSHDNTSEEATSTRGTKSAADLESEVEVTGYDTAYPMPINVASHVTPSPHAAAVARSPYVSVISRWTTKGFTGSLLPFPKRPVCRIVIPETARETKPTELRVQDC